MTTRRGFLGLLAALAVPFGRHARGVASPSRPPAALGVRRSPKESSLRHDGTTLLETTRGRVVFDRDLGARDMEEGVKLLLRGVPAPRPGWKRIRADWVVPVGGRVAHFEVADARVSRGPTWA